MHSTYSLSQHHFDELVNIHWPFNLCPETDGQVLTSLQPISGYIFTHSTTYSRRSLLPCTRRIVLACSLLSKKLIKWVNFTLPLFLLFLSFLVSYPELRVSFSLTHITFDRHVSWDDLCYLRRSDCNWRRAWNDHLNWFPRSHVERGRGRSDSLTSKRERKKSRDILGVKYE